MSKLDLASYALMMMMKGPKVWITICKTQMDEEEWLLGGSMRSQSFSDQFSAFTMATRPSALGMSDPVLEFLEILEPKGKGWEGMKWEKSLS